MHRNRSLRNQLALSLRGILVLLSFLSFSSAYAANDNPIVIWNFNEGKGTTTSATIVNGTSTYTATAFIDNYYSAWVNSYSGGGSALEFHGQVGDGVAFPDNSFGYVVPDPSRFGSLNFHIKLNSRTKDQVIFSADVRDTSGRYEVVHVNPLGQIVISWRNGYGSTLSEITSNEAIDVGLWHYVSIVHGMGRIASLTVDDRTFTLTGATTDPAWFNEFLGTNVSYHLGVAKNRDFTGILDGTIDEVTYPYNTLTAVMYVPQVEMVQTVPLPQITLTATKTSQTYANVAAIKWTTKNADFCDATGDWSKGNVGTKGVYYYNMPTTTVSTGTFSLLCFSGYGQASATTTLTVQPLPVKTIKTPLPPPLPPPPAQEPPPPPTLEMMLAAAPPPPPPSSEPVHLGDIKYATENATGLMYLQWTTNVPATSKLVYRVAGAEKMTDAVTDPFPTTNHDARINVTPGQIVTVRVFASDAQGRTKDAKEYQFISPEHFSERNVFLAGGIDPKTDEIAPVEPVATSSVTNIEPVPISGTVSGRVENNTDSITRTENDQPSNINAKSITMFLIFVILLSMLLYIQYQRHEFPFANKYGAGVKQEKSNN